MAFREDYFGGAGIAPLESIACNTPVVSKSLQNIPKHIRSKVGRMPLNENEMVKDILYVLDHPEEFKSCRNILFKFFDYSVVQKYTSEIYSKLVHK